MSGHDTECHRHSATSAATSMPSAKIRMSKMHGACYEIRAATCEESGIDISRASDAVAPLGDASESWVCFFFLCIMLLLFFLALYIQPQVCTSVVESNEVLRATPMPNRHGLGNLQK